MNNSILSSVDELGRHYIEDLIDGVTTSADNNTNVSVFLFENESSSTIQYMYSAHLIEGTNFILFTRASLADFTDISLNNYIDYVTQYYANKERHAFIIATDGTMLYHKDTDKIGINVSEMEDEVWKKTGTEVLEFMETNTEGFFNVTFYANTIDGDVSERVLYLKYNPEWDIIVGYGENTNLYDSLVDDFQNDSIKQVFVLLVPIYVIIAGLVFFITRLIIKNNNLSMMLFNEEEELYRIFSDISEDLIVITDKTGDIKFTNKLGRKVIFDTEEDKLVNLDEIMIDEEGFKVLLGVKENYYIKYTVSQIQFNGQEADLYVVTDVTEKVRTERKLEALTLADDLTGLGNRRLLVKDYANRILPQIKDGNKAFLAMLDLDNFKPANDVYGHSYGDEVLKQISEIFKKESNENIKIYRVGGDEFAILASEITQNDFLALLRKLKNKVVNFKYEKEVNISFSAGVIEINIDDKKRRLSDYYEKADELMYKAKEQGKSTIITK